MAPTKHNQPALFTPAPLPVADLDDNGRLACLRLIRSTNVGPATFRDLINHFGGAGRALDALPGLTTSRTRGRAVKICSQQDAEAELEAAHKAGAKPLFTIEPGYPHRLANLETPPPLLYVTGNSALAQKSTLAIVGARQASAAGTKLARMFASRLGQQGLVIVSGLARGIDAAAHEAALDTGTIAIVAGGIDVIYPPEHARLHQQICETGCIISEMPCGFQPRAKDFPRRNRLISGLSIGVLVVEAAQRSGSLVTARLAAEQNREVFAIPGHPLDPRAQGTNQLLKNGVTLVTEPNDILEALEPITAQGSREFREPTTPPIADPRTKPDAAPLSPPSAPTVHAEAGPSPPFATKATTPIQSTERDRTDIINALGASPIDLDEVMRATGLSTGAVRAAMIELELAGLIERHGAALVSLRPNASKD